MGVAGCFKLNSLHVLKVGLRLYRATRCTLAVMMSCLTNHSTTLCLVDQTGSIHGPQAGQPAPRQLAAGAHHSAQEAAGCLQGLRGKLGKTQARTCSRLSNSTFGERRSIHIWTAQDTRTLLCSLPPVLVDVHGGTNHTTQANHTICQRCATHSLNPRCCVACNHKVAHTLHTHKQTHVPTVVSDNNKREGTIQTPNQRSTLIMFRCLSPICVSSFAMAALLSLALLSTCRGSPKVSPTSQ